MLSFLGNRRYHKLSRELPLEIRADLPQVVCFPLFNGGSSWREQMHREEAQPQVDCGRVSALQDCKRNCCPACFTTDNIHVDQYGINHVCIKCRNLVRDQYGNQTRIFVDENNQIVCLGIINKNSKKIYYETDPMKLELNNKAAFATFANSEDLVILLRDQSRS